VTNDLWISIGLLVLVPAFVVVTGIRKQATIGTIVAAVIIGISIYFRKRGLETLGFYAPPNWLATVLWSLGLGIALGFLYPLILEPAGEKIAEERHDWKRLAGVRGNWKQLLLMLALAWVLAAFLEETIFRAFLMTELGRVIGFDGAYAAIALFASAAVFGFAYWYRGKGAVLSMAVLGLLLGNVFVWGGYNLWMLIITRAVAETVGLLLIFFDVDKRLIKRIWKEKK
jgi:membrane protease YdiL (CAAX protease family)